MIKQYAVLVLSLSLLTGCVLGSGPPSLEEMENRAPDCSSEITVGQMEREYVRSVFGAPHLSSTYWGFDLFLEDAKKTNPLIALVPYPIPIGWETNKWSRYTLVAYDANNRASAVATGIYSRTFGSMWPLLLRAGELLFYNGLLDSEQDIILLSSRGRDAFLQHARLSKGCSVVLGCGDRDCFDTQLSVDAGPTRRLPMQFTISIDHLSEKDKQDLLVRDFKLTFGNTKLKKFDVLVVLKVAAGEHVFEFSCDSPGGKCPVKFVCLPGEVSYLVVDASYKMSSGFFGSKLELVDWKIDRSDTMPECFARRPLVLLYEGQWYVDANLNE